MSSSLIRWALWASRHLHASWMKKQGSEARVCSVYPRTLRFCCLCENRRVTLIQEVFPGQWRCVGTVTWGLTVHTVQCFGFVACNDKYLHWREKKISLWHYNVEITTKSCWCVYFGKPACIHNSDAFFSSIKDDMIVRISHISDTSSHHKPYFQTYSFLALTTPLHITSISEPFRTFTQIIPLWQA